MTPKKPTSPAIDPEKLRANTPAPPASRTLGPTRARRRWGVTFDRDYPSATLPATAINTFSRLLHS
ncbi:MAG: hypothetical protein ACMG6S_13105 [Byssovorax sp.]